MKLSAENRSSEKKSDVKKLRREGKIPAILYLKGKHGKKIMVDRIAFQKIINAIEPGTISTKIFDLDFEGEPFRAVLKEIQYAPTTYETIHLDFAELHEGIPVTVNVPIQLTHAEECLGVKLGGALRPILRFLKVRCMPDVIPSHFELDVRELGLNQTKKLGDIQIPSHVKPLKDLREVAVVVAKR